MCVYINSESLPNNFECLEMLMERMSPLMVFCSETCLTEKIADSEISVIGYRTVRCDSHSRHTGGVAIYVRENILFETILNLSIDRNVWYLSIKIKRGGVNGIYSVLYHSPNSSHSNFLTYFEQILNENVDSEMMNTIIGDFNIDLMKSPYADRLVRLCESHAIKQRVNFVTRSTNMSETRIDLCFSNEDRVSCLALEKERISDHETIAGNIRNEASRMLSVERNIRSWENYSKDALMELLQMVNWGRWYECCLEEKVIFMNDVLCEAMNNLTFEKTIKVKTKNRWYDRELCEMNKDKYRLSQCVKTDQRYLNDYYTVKRLYKKMIKRKKTEYIQGQIRDSENDQKQMWKQLKKIVKIDTNVERMNEIKFNNVSSNDVKEIRCKFNDYFIDSILQIQREIDEPARTRNDVANPGIDTAKFKFREVSLQEITDIIMEFKNDRGGNKLVTYGVLKDAVEIVSYFYMEIVNESLRTGYIPNV